MANKPIKAKINVTKILKEHLFKGEKGTYLNLVIWPCKDGVDQYGNTHSIQQDIPKEVREQGVKAPYIGEMRIESTISHAPTTATEAAPEYDGGGSDVPF